MPLFSSLGAFSVDQLFHSTCLNSLESAAVIDVDSFDCFHIHSDRRMLYAWTCLSLCKSWGHTEELPANQQCLEQLLRLINQSCPLVFQQLSDLSYLLVVRFKSCLLFRISRQSKLSPFNYLSDKQGWEWLAWIHYGNFYDWGWSYLGLPWGTSQVYTLLSLILFVDLCLKMHLFSFHRTIKSSTVGILLCGFEMAILPSFLGS